MKKIFLSIMTVAVAAACSKSSVQYDDDLQIGFAPVAKNITKSVAGVGQDGAYDATFPTDLDLYISANVQDQDADGDLVDGSWGTTYFKNAKFIYDRIDNGVYEGDEPRYWPNVKSLVFAGYSNACNIDDIAANSTVTFDEENETSAINIYGYVQDNTNTAAGANDLMWFPWDKESYTKQSNAVAAQMKHACAWISVKVKRDGETTNDSWKLDGLKINGLYHEGDVVCGDAAADWTVSGETAAETVFSEAGTDLSTTAEVFEDVDNNFVVIPQVPTTIDVTYSYVPQEGVAPVQETFTNLSLKFNGNAEWESGKHYIYTITITATEIFVAPEVDEWDPYEGNDIVPVQ